MAVHSSGVLNLKICNSSEDSVHIPIASSLGLWNWSQLRCLQKFFTWFFCIINSLYTVPHIIPLNLFRKSSYSQNIVLSVFRVYFLIDAKDYANSGEYN